MRRTILEAENRVDACDDRWASVPKSLRRLDDPPRDLPRIAKDRDLMREIEAAVRELPTRHEMRLGDARDMRFLRPGSVQLVLTSPPYWTLKKYNDVPGQLGAITEYEGFLRELDSVWAKCFDALVPGGRLIIVVGDVCLSRRKNQGRHCVVPLHASIQEHCRELGYDNLATIFWYKIANAVYEVDNGSSAFLGKPYEPNAVIKNDVEFILMQRKPGGYRKPDLATRVLSLISEENHKEWFQQVWSGMSGAPTREHPAPFPVAIAERLIRMFSFVGDTVLDPFMGTASTLIAALRNGRHSLGVEIDPEYFEIAESRVRKESADLFRKATVLPVRAAQRTAP